MTEQTSLARYSYEGGAPELLRARNGGFSLRVRSDSGSHRILHSLYDPAGEARRLTEGLAFDGRGLLVVLGLGLGYHVRELANRFPEARLVVVECSPSIFELAERHGPAVELSSRVHWIVGSSQRDVVREITRIQIEAGMAPLCVFPWPSAVSAFSRYYEPLLRTLRKSVSVRLWDRLRYPKFRQEPFRVLLIDFNYFLTQEVARAFRSAGHRVVRIPVQTEENGERIVERYVAEILRTKPDFIFTINHLGFDEEGILTSFFASIEMPVASWYVDSPNLIVKAFPGNVSPLTSVFVWDRTYVAGLKEMGFEHVDYLPLATDPTVFRPMGNRRTARSRYGCDAGFVGDSMVAAVERWTARLPPAFRPVVEDIARAMDASGRSLEGVLETLDEERRALLSGLNQKEWMDFQAAVLSRVTMLYRIDCLRALEGFDLKVCGDEGWDGLLPPGVRRLPPLDYYRELPGFYNACRVNLNATSRQMAEAVNQRVFDVPACGAFLLTDDQRALGELFEIGREIIVYRDKDEIPDLARHYLRNARARKDLAARGRARVLGEHTYRHRVAMIIARMRDRYG